MFYLIAAYIFIVHLLTYPVYPITLALRMAIAPKEARYWRRDALYRWRVIAGTLSRCPFVLHSWLCKRDGVVKHDPKAFLLPNMSDLWGGAMDAAAIIISRRRKTFRYRADNGQLLERGLQLKALRADMLAHPDRYPPLAKGAEKMM